MPMPPRAVVCSVLLRGVGIRPWPSLPADYLVSVSLWCWCPLSLGSTRGDGMSLAQVFVLIWCWWLVTTFCWLSLNIINHKTRSPQIEPLGTLKPRNRSVMLLTQSRSSKKYKQVLITSVSSSNNSYLQYTYIWLYDFDWTLALVILNK